jgi:cysteine synthase A
MSLAGPLCFTCRFGLLRYMQGKSGRKVPLICNCPSGRKASSYAVRRLFIVNFFTPSGGIVTYKDNAIEMIGDTPLVALHALAPAGSTLLAKAEFMNPGGSIKDRAARYIIESAYRSGTLHSGQPVVEMTSGNMGAGLAVVCAVMGNPFIAVLSRGNNKERARMLSALGAEVVLVDQVDGHAGQVTGSDIAAAALAARRIAQERGGFYVDQFNNIGSIEAHEKTTGPEVLAAAGTKLSAFVSVVGSGGTFVGVSRYLKRNLPAVVCAVVEPQGAAVLAGRSVTKARHILQGTGYGTVPPHWDHSLADHYLAVSDAEAEEFKSLLARREGLHVGHSSAANVCAASKLIATGVLGASPTVVTVLCDTGLKYP